MNEPEELKEKLGKTNELLDKLDYMLAEGEITEAKYKQLSKKYRAEVESLKNQIAEGVLKQEFGIKTEEEERAEKAKQEEERLRIQIEEKEHITRGREEPRTSTESKGMALKTFFSVALLLGVLIVLIMVILAFLAPGVTTAPEKGKTTPTSTPLPPPTIITPPLDIQKTITNPIGIKFVLIPAGEFNMGSPSNEAGRWDYEGPVHRVKIANAFYMGKYEVTQKQWRDVMGTNPSYFKGDNLPVEQVSWNAVQEFIKKLNEKEGTNKYRLPSEAEWEYAARAGTTTSFSFGNDESKLGDYAWYNANSGSKTHEVGQKKPNPWGLYDMHGNVWEWVQDIYQNNYNGAPTDGSAWEVDGSPRVCRGGSWGSDAKGSRSAIRGSNIPTIRNGYGVGFRLLKDL